MKGGVGPDWISLRGLESGFVLVWDQILSLPLPVFPSHPDSMGMRASLCLQVTKTFSDSLNSIVQMLKRKPLTVCKFTFFQSFSENAYLAISYAWLLSSLSSVLVTLSDFSALSLPLLF